MRITPRLQHLLCKVGQTSFLLPSTRRKAGAIFLSLLLSPALSASELMTFRAGPAATYQTQSQYVVSPYIGWAPAVFFPDLEGFFVRGMLGAILTKSYGQSGISFLADLALLGGYRLSDDFDIELGGGMQMIPMSSVTWVPFGRAGVSYFFGNSYGFEKSGFSLILDYTISLPLSTVTHGVLLGIQLTL